MLDWISHLFSSSDADPESGTVDSRLLFRLREELNECEAIYRAVRHVCLQTCRDAIDGDPDNFLERMIDLHRGLLIKIFVEISDCERHWHPEERELARELLQHVWGVDIDKDKLMEVLHNVAELDELRWEQVLGPFIRIPALNEQLAELCTCIMRIAHLIVKADGHILPAEAERLRRMKAEIEPIVRSSDSPAEKSAGSVAQAGKQVAQLLQSRTTRRGKSKDGKSAATSPSGESRDESKSAKENLAEAIDLLNHLIGLDSLKKEIRQLVNFLKVQEQRQSHELPRTQISLHSVFLGNPGTGKTTVARILARVLRGLNLLSKGHTVEIDRAGLVAEYAGQTGPKVHKCVDEALDGILFIDEAYSLIAQTGDDPFGSEAVQVLLKRMEDDRDRLVVVLAGYPQPMERMLKSNPGLCSRFQRTFHFPDYNPNELLEIFDGLCAKAKYVLTDAGRQKLRAVLQKAFDERDEYFGNGRLVRNIFEQAIGLMANRIVEIVPVTCELLSHLEPEDIQLTASPAA